MERSGQWQPCCCGFDLSSAAILIGAQVNVELLKAAHDNLPVKEVPKAGTENKAPVRLVG